MQDDTRNQYKFIMEKELFDYVEGERVGIRHRRHE